MKAEQGNLCMEKGVLKLKNGLFFENDELIYYQNGAPVHAGVIQVGEDIYYIRSAGKAVKGRYVVHREMTNGILEHGTYTFGEDYKLIPDSYVAPKYTKRKKGGPGDRRKESLWRRLKRIVRKKENLIALLMVVLVLGLILMAYKIETASKQEKDPSVTQSAESPFKPKETVNTPETETQYISETETANTAETEAAGVEETVAATESAKEDVKVKLPQYNEDVLLCSEAAKMEYDGKITLKAAVDAGDPYRPFVFAYSFTNCSGTLLLGERADFSDAVRYELPESQRSIEIHNLKVDTDYYYKVLVAGQEHLGTFHTALSTRYIYIPGLENVRDIGGITTLDGKRIKQGVLIRGVEPDGLSTVECFIPDDKLEEAKQLCNFVYDMDLRAKRVYLGDFTSRWGIPHEFYYAPQYGEVFNTGFRASLKRVFSALANAENYPMYMHCTWGRDRTGTTIYLLQGVLNVSEEDMVQEYLRSSYWYKKMVTSEDLRVIVAGMEPYAGNTLQEKIVTFLITEIGLTEDEIASIRSIFLEEVR